MSGINADKLLAKITHYDKDERYMCLIDICHALTAMPQNVRLEPSNETKLLKAILVVLDKDTVVDVQAIAVRTLSLLVTKISESAVADLCDKLSSQVFVGPKEMRDVYAVGLKTILLEVPNTPQMASAVLKAILPKVLSQGLKDPSSSVSAGNASNVKADVRSESLEVALDLVKRFGFAFQAQDAHDLMMATVECVLDKNQVNIRRRATVTLGALSLYLSDAQLDQLVGTLLGHIDSDQKRKSAASSAMMAVEEDESALGGGDGLNSPKSPSIAAAGGWLQRTMVQTIGAISRQVGQRLGRFIERIVPLFLSVLGATPEEAGAGDESGNTAIMATELRENILAAFESLFGPQGQLSTTPLSRGLSSTTSSSSSSSSSSSFLATDTLRAKKSEVLKSCVAWSSFDPNYNYGENIEEDVSMMAAEDDAKDGDIDCDDDFEDGGGYDDADTDDDISWKVRKAAVRVLTAVISSSHESGDIRENLNEQIFPLIGKTIVHRFVERQETVRLEVIACAEALLLASHNASTAASSNEALSSSTLSSSTSSSSSSSSSFISSSTDMDAFLSSGTVGQGAYHVPASLSASASSAQAHHSITTGTMTSSSSSTSSATLLQQSQQLNAFVRILIPAAVKLLKSTQDASHNVKTRIAILKLLRTLLLVVDCESVAISGARIGSGRAATLFLPALPALLPAIYSCLKDKSSNGSSSIKIEACHLLHTLLLVYGASPSSLSPFIQVLCERVAESCSDDYFRIVSVSLRSAATLTTLIFPSSGSPTLSPSIRSSVTRLLLKAVMNRLASPNVDQEIKEGAITAAGILLAHAGTETAVKDETGEIFKHFTSRIKSENTRLQVLRSLAYAGASRDLVPGLAEMFVSIMPDLASFLKQAARPLRAQTLSTVNSLFNNISVSKGYNLTKLLSSASSTSSSSSSSSLSSSPSSNGISGLTALVADAASPLNLTERDLHMSHLSFEMFISVVGVCAPVDAASILLSTSAFARTVELSRSPLVQGIALSSLCSVIRVVATLGSINDEFKPLSIIGDIIGAIQSESADSHGGLNSIQSSAKAIATAMAADKNSPGFEALLTLFVEDATSGQGGLTSRKVDATNKMSFVNDTKKVSLPLLSRYIVSECARLFDLHSIKKSYLHDLIQCVLTDKFLSTPSSSSASSATAAASSTSSGAGSAAADDMRTAAALALGGLVAHSSFSSATKSTHDALSLLLKTAETCLEEANAAVEANKAEKAEVERLRREAEKISSEEMGNVRDPKIISNFITSTKPYAMLQAVREVVLRFAPCSPLAPEMPSSVATAILSLLVKPIVCGIDEEGVRNIAAECLGKLAVASPSLVLTEVKKMATSSNSLIRWTAASMMRFTMLSSSVSGGGLEVSSSLMLLPNIEKELSTSLVDLFACLRDKSESVRLAAVTALNTLIHGASNILYPYFKRVDPSRFPFPTGRPALPPLVPPSSQPSSASGGGKASSDNTPSPPTLNLLDDGAMWTPPVWPDEGFLAVLLYECVARSTLIREVELGPFRHVIDDNVSTRKASFASLESIIDRFPLQYLGPEILYLLCSGMKDTAPTVQDSARILAHSAFNRACSRGLPALSRLLGLGLGGGGGGGNGEERSSSVATTTSTASTNSNHRALLDLLASSIEVSVIKVSEKSTEGELDLARSALRSLNALKKVLPEAPLLSSKVASLINIVQSDPRLNRLNAILLSSSSNTLG
jgi:hypothetical protein